MKKRALMLSMICVMVVQASDFKEPPRPVASSNQRTLVFTFEHDAEKVMTITVTAPMKKRKLLATLSIKYPQLFPLDRYFLYDDNGIEIPELITPAWFHKYSKSGGLVNLLVVYDEKK